MITFSNCVGVLSGSARKRFFLAAEISRDLSAVHGDTRRKRQSHGYQLGVRELQTCTFENIGQNSNRAEFNTTRSIRNLPYRTSDGRTSALGLTENLRTTQSGSLSPAYWLRHRGEKMSVPACRVCELDMIRCPRAPAHGAAPDERAPGSLQRLHTRPVVLSMQPQGLQHCSRARAHDIPHRYSGAMYFFKTRRCCKRTIFCLGLDVFKERFAHQVFEMLFHCGLVDVGIELYQHGVAPR